MSEYSGSSDINNCFAVKSSCQLLFYFFGMHCTMEKSFFSYTRPSNFFCTVLILNLVNIVITRQSNTRVH